MPPAWRRYCCRQSDVTDTGCICAVQMVAGFSMFISEVHLTRQFWISTRSRRLSRQGAFLLTWTYRLLQSDFWWPRSTCRKPAMRLICGTIRTTLVCKSSVVRAGRLLPLHVAATTSLSLPRSWKSPERRKEFGYDIYGSVTYHAALSVSSRYWTRATLYTRSAMMLQILCWRFGLSED